MAKAKSPLKTSDATGVGQRPIIRGDLVPPPTLMHHFSRIRNILAGQAERMTHDQTLVNELVNILFCKMYDEQLTPTSKPVSLQLLPGENPDSLAQRVERLFTEVKTREDIGSLFEPNESIRLTPKILSQVVTIIQPYELTHAKRDIIGEAFESVIGSTLRGEEGQFFTPRNVVELACAMLNPKSGEIMVDPACGTGGFLTQVIRNSNGEGTPKVLGIDKDAFLAKVAAIQIGLLRQDASSWAFCANSLSPLHNWPPELLTYVQPSMVDVVMTNPPFGTQISVGGTTLRQYSLGRIWKRSKDGVDWGQTLHYATDRPPQILFIERCLELLKPGGRLGIVVPDGILGNVSDGYVRSYIRSIADVVAIVDLPLETFLPSTSTKTSLLFLRKKSGSREQKKVFMAMPRKCGHDRRGKPIYAQDGRIDDDLPKVAEEFHRWAEEDAPDF